MKYVYILFVALLTMYFIGCRKVTGPSEFNNGDLYKTWVHSYEEQNTYDPQLFRPIDYKEFEPSRFRMQYTFREDGSCQWMVLDPRDAHYLQSGTFLRTERTVFIFDSDERLQEDVSFKITSLEKNLLEATTIE